ncbi:MAG: PDR/VanB family oxidoreductase [Sneathiella sp.]|uniref:PDR/VanB family oxidoreductase n=1 Tax=Sneathiella sp. TaxID=1964365 RepID=UPI0030017690
MTSDLISVKVVEKSSVTDDYCVMKLTALDGAPLPMFSAGAHISAKTPQGGMRNFSLANDPEKREYYLLGIKAERNGRGASASMVDTVKAGDVLEILAPENDFELVSADQYLFIAGGIGITPILSMCRQLLREGNENFKLIYCSQSPDTTVFLDDVTAPDLAPYVTLHHDKGELSALYDFWPHMEIPDKRHIYCCGPKPMMEDIKDMSGHWPESQIHFEDFNPVQVLRADDRAFEVYLSKSGRRLRIPENQSILETLRSEGYDLKSSCESGSCGTCRTTLISGNADHRDLVLTDMEKETSIMICVSRAKNGELVLDI